MRFTTTSALLALPLLALADKTPLTQTASPTALETSTPAAPNAEPPAPTAFAPTTPDPETDTNEEYEEYEDELRRRQNPGQIVGENVPPQTIATQKSPITTFFSYDAKGNQVPVVYTQLFSAVPEQWPEPQSGSIGLGTIQGQIGVVKATKSKRGIVARATDFAKRAGGAGGAGTVQLEPRAKGKGSSGGSGNKNGTDTGAASAKEVPWLGGAVLVAGLLAEFL